MHGSPTTLCLSISGTAVQTGTQPLQQQQNPEAHAKGTLNLKVLYRYVNSFGPGYAIPVLTLLYAVTQVGVQVGCMSLPPPLFKVPPHDPSACLVRVVVCAMASC
jgi:hypothetical protein